MNDPHGHRLSQALSAAATGIGEAQAALAEARDLANCTGRGVAFWTAHAPHGTPQPRRSQAHLAATVPPREWAFTCEEVFELTTRP